MSGNPCETPTPRSLHLTSHFFTDRPSLASPPTGVQTTPYAECTQEFRVAKVTGRFCSLRLTDLLAESTTFLPLKRSLLFVSSLGKRPDLDFLPSSLRAFSGCLCGFFLLCNFTPWPSSGRGVLSCCNLALDTLMHCESAHYILVVRNFKWARPSVKLRSHEHSAAFSVPPGHLTTSHMQQFPLCHSHLPLS